MVSSEDDIVEVLIVMRHGCRADKAGEKWAESQSRPWDPPLSSLGWKEARGSGSNICKFLKNKQPDLIFTSPYTRCLQTASTVLKVCGLSFQRMIIDKGLAETYDYLHTVRAVSSEDLMVDGKFSNMNNWFFSKRVMEHSGWRLTKGLNQSQRVDAFVYEPWKEPNKRRFPIREQGRFPNFEMYVNMGFNTGKQVKRYATAMGRCVRYLRRIIVKEPRVAILVTHGAGVRGLYEHLLQETPEQIDTAGYFIVGRDRRGAHTLLQNRLAKHHMIK